MKKILLFCLFPIFLCAQPGTDLYVSFPASSPLLAGDSVKIWIHIPENYPSSGGGVMVALHGLGDPNNSSEIRNYLSPTSEDFDLLLVCPEPYLGNNTALIEQSKAVVEESLDSVYAWYNTDLEKTYLCGYSAGSDVAAHFTLENPAYPVKGLIWFAPGFYGSFLAPNIDTAFAAPIPPICMCRGTEDVVSISAANTIDSIFSNSTVPYLKLSPLGIAHTMNYPAFTADIATCMNFINEGIGTGITAENLSKFNVFPNPVEDKLFIEMEEQSALHVDVVDVSGRICLVESYAANVLHMVSLPDLDIGIYFVRIRDEKGTVVIHKLVKK